MSHEVTVREDGTAEAAYALKPAWHGLGTVLDHTMDSAEAMKVAQLNWDVEQEPLYWHEVKDEMIEGKHVVKRHHVPGSMVNLRSDNHEVLGVVSDTYKVVQNSEAFGFVDDLLPDGIIKYDSVGSLKGGKVVWLLAKMPEEFEVAAGDTLEQYILFLTAHDGSHAVQIMPTSVRVVCWNTYKLATQDATKRMLSMRHTTNIKDRLEEARQMLMSVNKKFNKYHETARALAKTSIDGKKFQAFLNVLIPDEEHMNNTRRENKRRAIEECLLSHENQLPSMRGTAWAAFNAVTQWADHDYNFRETRQTSREENRMASALWGSQANFKSSALALATKAFLD